MRELLSSHTQDLYLKLAGFAGVASSVPHQKCQGREYWFSQPSRFFPINSRKRGNKKLFF